MKPFEVSEDYLEQNYRFMKFIQEHNCKIKEDDNA